MLTALVAFVPAAALLVVAPGPDTLLVLRNSARGGRRAGLITAAGTVTGLLVWAAAAALGLAALVRASEIGPDSEPAHRHRVTDYLSGIGTNLFNPKVGVFFVSFLPVFIPRGMSVAPMSLLLGAIFLVEGIIWLVTVVLLGDRLSALIRRPRIRRRLERLTGVVMIGFGLRLATEHR